MPKDKTLKTNSIYYRFLKLLALALVTAALFFLLLNQGGEKLLDYYFTKTIIWSGKMRGDTMIWRDYVKEKQIVHGRHGQAGRMGPPSGSRLDADVPRSHSVFTTRTFPYIESQSGVSCNGPVLRMERL